MSVTSSWAVVVNITGVSGGEPVPGTTISLEAVTGEEIPLELATLEDISLDESLTETAEDGQIVSEASGPSTETAAQENVVPQTTGEDVAKATGGGDKEKKNIVTVTAVPVTGTGTTEFVVGDQYQGEEVVLVVRDQYGAVIERKKLFLAGATVAVNVAQLANALPSGTQAAQASGASNAANDASVSSSERIASSTGDDLEADMKDHYSLSVEFEYGRLRRDTFNALRLQSGGGATILQDSFASHSRSSEFMSFAVEGYGDLGREAPIFGTNLYVIGSARHAMSSSSSYDMNVSTGGQALGILSPAGPTGGLGGGVNVNAPNADLNFVKYHDDYSETIVIAGLMTMIERGELMFTNGASLFYGHTSERLDYSGRTNSNTLDFAFSVNTSSHRIGLQLSTEAEWELVPQIISYAGIDLRLVQNYGKSDATLNLSGALNATESASATANKLDVGAVIKGGVRVKRGNNNFDFGARFETWQIPVAQVIGEQPLFIDYKSRNSFSGYVRFVRTF